MITAPQHLFLLPIQLVSCRCYFPLSFLPNCTLKMTALWLKLYYDLMFTSPRQRFLAPLSFVGILHSRKKVMKRQPCGSPEPILEPPDAGPNDLSRHLRKEDGKTTSALILISHPETTRPLPRSQEGGHGLVGISLPGPPLLRKVIKLLFSPPPRLFLHASVWHQGTEPRFSATVTQVSSVSCLGHSSSACPHSLRISVAASSWTQSSMSVCCRRITKGAGERGLSRAWTPKSGSLYQRVFPGDNCVGQAVAHRPSAARRKWNPASTLTTCVNSGNLLNLSELQVPTYPMKNTGLPELSRGLNKIT